MDLTNSERKYVQKPVPVIKIPCCIGKCEKKELPSEFIFKEDNLLINSNGEQISTEEAEPDNN